MTTAATVISAARRAREHEPWRTVLVYEDFEMAIHGKHVHDVFAWEVAGGDDHADLVVWRFNLLQFSEEAELAARRAAQADLIIVAPRDLNQLPAAVKEWLEKWPPDRGAEGGALVTLFHPDSQTTADACGEALLLWRAAERARMDFFCAAAGRKLHPGADVSKDAVQARVPLAVATV